MELSRTVKTTIFSILAILLLLVGHVIVLEYPNNADATVGPGNILTVADDLLKNDGQKFLEMMEQLAERRMQREEEAAAEVGLDSEDEDDEEDGDDEDEEDEEDEDDDEEEDEVSAIHDYFSRGLVY